MSELTALESALELEELGFLALKHTVNLRLGLLELLVVTVLGSSADAALELVEQVGAGWLRLEMARQCGLGRLVGWTVCRGEEGVWLRSTNVTTSYVLEGAGHLWVWGPWGEEEGLVVGVACEVEKVLLLLSLMLLLVDLLLLEQILLLKGVETGMSAWLGRSRLAESMEGGVLVAVVHGGCRGSLWLLLLLLLLLLLWVL